MHSHKILAFLALAASTATPALSAPVVEGQEQARATFSDRDLQSFLDDFKTLGEFVKNTTGLRREPSPLTLPDLSGIGKTILGAGTSLGAADIIKGLFDSNSTSRRDLNEALQLLSRQLDELD
ncbi:hypothetical protein EDB92DRAFT_2115317 [Lactarius akahatsu]|uniref:Uncharacterized protein n=1 Tax=Lactarius akahatsu TaxID=416441 RepID=A0AAD4QCL8_9AGAM|nr:hypothetical protein EDB92DRAFT_2115317 [Lactarius akahatsu]